MRNRVYKVFLRVISSICLFALLFSFSACNGANSDENQTEGEKYHVITFNSNGGSLVESIKVRDNQYATRPEDPELDNYIFSRWERNGRAWLFESKRVTESMTLSALWVSAVDLFDLVPTDDGNALFISDFKKQASFTVLNVPSTINGKTVVGITENGFENTNVDHANTIILPESIVYVGDSTFKGSMDVIFDIRGTLRSIGESTFEDCRMLDKVKLGDGIEKIPFMCFSGCSALKNIDIPTTVSVIEENAFEECISMISAVIPASLTSIEDSAFLGCKSFHTIFYKGTQEQFEQIDIADGNEAFEQANLYFYSEEEPTDNGNYWHYEDGSAMIW